MAYWQWGRNSLEELGAATASFVRKITEEAKTDDAFPGHNYCYHHLLHNANLDCSPLL